MKITAVMVLIVANVAVYLLKLAGNQQLENLLALWPLQPLDGHVYFHFWQIVTYSFLHDPDNKFHLLFNMLQLWMFGAEVERYVGFKRLLACYFASVVTAALAQLLVPFVVAGPIGPTLGASGGVFGLLLAYAMLSDAQGHSADTSHPHAGMAVRDDLRQPGASIGCDRNTFRHCAFRPLGRDGRQRAGGHAMAHERTSAHGKKPLGLSS